jgi:tetratricopeptide (TPR) repeat protein
MKKIACCLFILPIFSFNVFAQSAAADKNTVMDFFQNQQFDEAVSYLTPAIAADTKNIQLLGFLGYAYYMNDNTREAENVYRQIVLIDPDNIPALQYLALLTKNDRPNEALQYTRRLILLQPAKPGYYRNMGELFKRKDEQDSAFVYFSKAYSLAPKDYKNGVGLADVLIDRKEYTNADSVTEAGLEQDSVNLSFLKLRIRSAYNAGNFQSLRMPGERIIRMGESPLTALTQVLIGYYNLKLYTDCIRICEYLNDKGYTVDNVIYYEAKAWGKLKDFDKSNELLKVCVHLSISKSAEMYYYSLALNYESLKQYAKAINQYDTAYYLFKNPVMNYNCGRIAEAHLHNMQQAQKYYLRYIAEAKPTEADEIKAYAYVKERWGKKKTTAAKK